MSGKIYSHIDKIPSGSASRKVTEGCLVLEGGAFRGLYSQGFMDAMMKAGINMQCTIGVSAGAMAAAMWESRRFATTKDRSDFILCSMILKNPIHLMENGSLSRNGGLWQWQRTA